jgi:hypothetical protein
MCWSIRSGSENCGGMSVVKQRDCGGVECESRTPPRRARKVGEGQRWDRHRGWGIGASALLPQTASTGPNPHVKFPGSITSLSTITPGHS